MPLLARLPVSWQTRDMAMRLKSGRNGDDDGRSSVHHT